MSAKYDFVHCPVCGKELINLCWYPGDLYHHHYWCDNCGIDVDIEEKTEDFKVRLKEITNPYRFSQPIGMEPLYDYGVCGVIEDFLYEEMDKGNISASFNYLDFDCDGVSVQGCMTITIMQDKFIPEVFTFLYERQLNTCE